jgi:hypothetical protein
MNLEDFFPSYPDIDDENLQGLIPAKFEFQKLKSKEREQVALRGELFNAQKFIHRYLKHYDRILLMWSTGTGKTCAAISVTEHCRDVATTLDNIAGFSTPYPIKGALIIVKGDTLESEMRKQIMCKCTLPERYMTESIANALTATGTEKDREKRLQSAITRSLHTWYTITHMRSFANQLHAMSDDQIVEIYSDHVIFMDEIQYIAVSSIDLDASAREIESSKQKETNVDTYRQILRFTRLIKRSKIIYATATPMVDKPEELEKILNLLNKENVPSFNYETVSLEQLEPYVRGKVSYVKEFTSGSVKRYIGESGLPNSRNRGAVLSKPVHIVGMYDGLQKTTYLEHTSSGEHKSGVVSDFARNKERRLSNFAISDGELFTRGAKDINFSLTDKGRSLLHITNIHSISCKMHFILYKLRKQQPGKTYIFSDFVTDGGVLAIGASLEANGYSRYNGKQRVTSSVNAQGLCGNPAAFEDENEDENAGIISSFGPEKRYAIITSDITPTERRAILELYNSRENMFGDYIAVLIGSPATGVGINLLEVMSVYIFEAQFNESRQYQAESRAIRAGSHARMIDMLKSGTLQIENLDKPGKHFIPGSKEYNDAYNYDNDTIFVDVYLLAAVTNVDTIGRSVDLDLYAMCEEKDRKIKRLERILKQCAIDCSLNRERNIPKGQTDGSQICDYDKCDYQCAISIPDTKDARDFTTFNAYYSDELVQQYVDYLYKLFISGRDQISIANIIAKSKNNELYIKLAVEKIVSSSTPILNRYGYSLFVRENKGMLFLTNNYQYVTASDQYAISYYNKSINAGRDITLRGLLKEQLDNNIDNLADYLGINISGPMNDNMKLAIRKRVSNFNYIQREKLVEVALNYYVKSHRKPNIGNEYALYILNDLCGHYVVLISREEYDEMVRNMTERVKTKQPTPGRPTDNPYAVKVNKELQMDAQIDPLYDIRVDSDINKYVVLNVAMSFDCTSQSGTHANFISIYLGGGRTNQSLRVYKDKIWSSISDGSPEYKFVVERLAKYRITIYSIMSQTSNAAFLISYKSTKYLARAPVSADGTGGRQSWGRDITTISADDLKTLITQQGYMSLDQSITLDEYEAYCIKYMENNPEMYQNINMLYPPEPRYPLLHPNAIYTIAIYEEWLKQNYSAEFIQLPIIPDEIRGIIGLVTKQNLEHSHISGKDKFQKLIIDYLKYRDWIIEMDF